MISTKTNAIKPQSCSSADLSTEEYSKNARTVVTKVQGHDDFNDSKPISRLIKATTNSPTKTKFIKLTISEEDVLRRELIELIK